MLNFVAPLLLVACISYLILTNANLPAHKLGFINKVFGFARRFPLASAEEGHQLATAKKNQFLLGEANFDVMALWLIGLPTVVGYLMWTPISQSYVDEERSLEAWDQERITRERCFSVSMLSGWYVKPQSLLCTATLAPLASPISLHSRPAGWASLLCLGFSFPLLATRCFWWQWDGARCKRCASTFGLGIFASSLSLSTRSPW